MLNNLHSFAASVAVGLRGYFANGLRAQEPAQPLELYEFEACPFCRKVRNALSELDINYICHPCAKDSNNRQIVIQKGGKAQFPFLIDPNQGVELYESEDIIDHLYQHYANGRPALDKAIAPIGFAGAAIASVVRPRGRHVRPGFEDRQQPEQRLELYGFEISPYCRKVREVLAELNLDYLQHNCAKRSTHRPDFLARSKKMQFPYLVDPNQGVEMFESDDIVAYLESTYGRPS